MTNAELKAVSQALAKAIEPMANHWGGLIEHYKGRDVLFSLPLSPEQIEAAHNALKIFRALTSAPTDLPPEICSWDKAVPCRTPGCAALTNREGGLCVDCARRVGSLAIHPPALRWEDQEKGHNDVDRMREEFRRRLYAKPPDEPLEATAERRAQGSGEDDPVSSHVVSIDASGRFFRARDMDLDGAYIGEITRCLHCGRLAMGESDEDCQGPYAIYTFLQVEDEEGRVICKAPKPSPAP